MRELLAKGADVNKATNHYRTALMFASDHGHAAIVAVLLAAGAGASINNADLNGETALKWAKAKGHANVVALLKRTILARRRLRKWRRWFRARGFTRYYWLRATERVYKPGAPGHAEAVAAWAGEFS